MKILEAKEAKSLTPYPCEHCGGLMRLVGSEPHPVEPKIDLLTYSCTACGAFQVTPVPLPAPSVTPGSNGGETKAPGSCPAPALAI
jgi:hypothetical protein